MKGTCFLITYCFQIAFSREKKKWWRSVGFKWYENRYYNAWGQYYPELWWWLSGYCRGLSELAKIKVAEKLKEIEDSWLSFFPPKRSLSFPFHLPSACLSSSLSFSHHLSSSLLPLSLPLFFAITIHTVFDAGHHVHLFSCYGNLIL